MGKQKDPFETLMAILDQLTTFCGQHEPASFGDGRDPEMVATVMDSWDTANTLSETFVSAWRATHGITPS